MRRSSWSLNHWIRISVWEKRVENKKMVTIRVVITPIERKILPLITSLNLQGCHLGEWMK